MQNKKQTARNRMLKSSQYVTWGLFALLVLFKIGPISAQGPEKGKVLMAIFAHPDDEMTVGPMLVKYVQEGVQVYLVVCTDGRYGTNDFSGLEGGEPLVKIRKAEMQCAADALGVTLIHLKYHDQLKAGEGYDGHVPHAQALVRELEGIIADKKPDVLVTWGPDGGTTHMDHRLVGASVTQIFVSRDWAKPSKLFFVGTPSSLIEDPAQKVLAGVDAKYLKTQVAYSEENLDQAMTALACHKSQIRPEDIGKIKENRQKTGMQINLREFVGPEKTRTSLFE
jgi:LmbE family N-acetylglucosaminyl deacetylase